MTWRSLWNVIPNPRAGYAREHRLNQAYQEVFRGNPSKEDQEIVLADLAFHSGFSMVTPHDASDAELRTNEGKRTLFARIRSRLTLTPYDHDLLENAARREAIMSMGQNAQ